MGRATVIASIKELESVNLLCKETRHKENGSLASNMYYPLAVLEGSSVLEPPGRGGIVEELPVVLTENHGSSQEEPGVVLTENGNNNSSNIIPEQIIIPNGMMPPSTDFVIVKQKAQTEAPGAAKPADLPEDIQTATPKQKAAKLSKNAKDSIYPKFIDIYDKWFKGHAGVAPKIDGMGGKAAKSMIAYLRGVSKVWDGVAWRMPETDEEFETAILNGWQYIFNNWGKLDHFYQNKTRLIDINSNFQNIISQIKNGHAKKSTVTNQTTAADLVTSFGKIDEYFKDREADQVNG